MKHIILLFLFILFFGKISHAQASDPCNNAITQANIAEFDRVVMNKVKELGTYIATVANKGSKLNDIAIAIKNAKRLFKQPDKDIRISTVADGQKYSYNVDKYFSMLSNVRDKYAEFKIDWANYYYATEYDQLKQGADGRYYGSITVLQCFEGKREGKKITLEKDCKKKTIEIIMEISCVRTHETCFCEAAIVLGDIDISQSQ
jgi:hypothetical protein